MAITEDGRLWGWGNATALGYTDNTPILTPTPIPPFENIDGSFKTGSMAVTNSQALCRIANSDVYYCGDFDQTFVDYQDMTKLEDASGNDFEVGRSEILSETVFVFMEGGGGHFFLVDDNGILYAF
jgi:hypothetical protein